MRNDNNTEDTHIKRVNFIVYLCIQTAIVAGFIMADHVRIGYVERDLVDVRVDIKSKFDASAMDRADLRKEINSTAQFSYRLDSIQKDISSVVNIVNEHLKESRHVNEKQ